MNWLAHLLLSEPTPEFRLGNVLPDLASATELAAMPMKFQEGIQRHRLIDAYTDAHPVVRRSIERLGPSMRRFGGIIVDIAYDHFLARHWERFSVVPLPDFAADVYAGFSRHWEVIPMDEQPRVAQMIVDNWLVSYRELPCIGAAIDRIGKRLRRPVDLSPAYEVLRRDTALFEADFAEFFPQLTASVWPEYSPPVQS